MKKRALLVILFMLIIACGSQESLTEKADIAKTPISYKQTFDFYVRNTIDGRDLTFYRRTGVDEFALKRYRINTEDGIVKIYRDIPERGEAWVRIEGHRLSGNPNKDYITLIEIHLNTKQKTVGEKKSPFFLTQIFIICYRIFISSDN